MIQITICQLSIVIPFVNSSRDRPSTAHCGGACTTWIETQIVLLLIYAIHVLFIQQSMFYPSSCPSSNDTYQVCDQWQNGRKFKFTPSQIINRNKSMLSRNKPSRNKLINIVMPLPSIHKELLSKSKPKTPSLFFLQREPCSLCVDRWRDSDVLPISTYACNHHLVGHRCALYCGHRYLTVQLNWTSIIMWPCIISQPSTMGNSYMRGGNSHCL